MSSYPVKFSSYPDIKQLRLQKIVATGIGSCRSPEINQLNNLLAYLSVYIITLLPAGTLLVPSLPMTRVFARLGRPIAKASALVMCFWGSGFKEKPVGRCWSVSDEGI